MSTGVLMSMPNKCLVITDTQELKKKNYNTVQVLCPEFLPPYTITSHLVPRSTNIYKSLHHNSRVITLYVAGCNLTKILFNKIRHSLAKTAKIWWFPQPFFYL